MARGGRKRRLALLALAAAPIFGVAASANGCYYLRVGYGQAKVLLGREAIEDAIEREGGLSAAEKAKLAMVPEIRRFAIETLGLADTGSYRTFYDTGEKPISYNVTACAKTSFTPYLWSFPFVGEAPYKGFFSLEEAKEQAAELEALGLDTRVSEVTAYSTLGWFEDPVFRRMLAHEVSDLAGTIIHELTHATVFKPGDTDFNESCATFVGDEGAIAFLAARYGPGSAKVQRARDEEHDQALFTGFIDDLYARLDRLYRSGASEGEKLAARERIFETAKAEFERVRQARFRTDLHAGFAKRTLNNAVILAYRAYHNDLAAFRDVYELLGGDWKRTLDVFRKAAGKRSPRGYLADWRVAAREARASRTAAAADDLKNP